MFRITRRRALALLAPLILAAALPACSGEAIPGISAAEALRQAQAGQLTIIDVRTPQEWRQTGVGPGVARIDMKQPDFAQRVLARVGGDKHAPIALICRTGNRSGQMQKALAAQGFTHVIHIGEGMAGSGAGPGWVRQGLPLEPCPHC